MLISNDDYLKILGKIIDCIKTSQYQVMLSANLFLMHRNWTIGNYINSNSSWGKGFLVNLSQDIKSEFPDSKGYSERNLRDMKKPIEVTEYKLFDDLPKELQGTMPSVEDIETRVMKKYECD